MALEVDNDNVCSDFYKKDILSSDKIDRAIAAQSKEAVFCEDEYKKLFDDVDYVKKSIAMNPDAVKFPQFETLFNCNNDIRVNIALNPNAPIKFEKSFRTLFYDDEIKCASALNPNAVNFTNEFLTLFKNNECKHQLSQNLNTPIKFKDEYKKFFKDEDVFIRENAAKNENAVNIDEYKQLLKDKNWNVRMAVAKNDNAIKLKEFKTLFKDRKKNVREYACNRIDKYKKHHGIKKSSDIDHNCLYEIDLINVNENITEFKYHKINYIDQLIEKINSKDIKDRISVAGNINAPLIPDYKKLFKEIYNESIASRIALNPSAVIWKEYDEFFNNDEKKGYRRVWTIHNPRAIERKKFQVLFKDENNDIRELACKRFQEYLDFHGLKKENVPNDC